MDKKQPEDGQAQAAQYSWQEAAAGTLSLAAGGRTSEGTLDSLWLPHSNSHHPTAYNKALLCVIGEPSHVHVEVSRVRRAVVNEGRTVAGPPASSPAWRRPEVRDYKNDGVKVGARSLENQANQVHPRLDGRTLQGQTLVHPAIQLALL